MKILAILLSCLAGLRFFIIEPIGFQANQVTGTITVCVALIMIGVVIVTQIVTKGR